MTDDPTEPSPERTQTDESLRTERDRADTALRSKQTELRHDADLVIQHARETADAVLVAERELADEQLHDTGPRSIIHEERLRQDTLLRDERASADEHLQHERDESISTLLRLLPLEREKTDRFLLTERIRSDEDVSHRDDFLGIVSHDLRNLLSGIVMSATLLSERASASEEGRRTIEGSARIQRYAARMNRLIGDLVDVAAIDAGKLSVTVTAGDTSAVIDEAIDMFQGLAHAKGLTLEHRITQRPLMASFDHDRIIQVLANLVTNAIKFTPAGGSIVVSNEPTAGGVLVTVQDTGIGIPRDKLETVFERFWQVGKNDRRGVGLGLYISRSIVVAHGGTITAETGTGQGCTFKFTLGA